MNIRKVMKKDVKKKMVKLFLKYAEENGLTISNVCEVTKAVIKHMEENATIKSPETL